MPASTASVGSVGSVGSVSPSFNRTASACPSRGKDIALPAQRDKSRTHSPKTSKPPRPPKPRVVLPPPDMTPEQAREKLATFTVDERRRLKAFCLNGTYKAAAEELDSDPHTVSDTVRKMVGFIAVLIDEVEQTPIGAKKSRRNSQPSAH